MFVTGYSNGFPATNYATVAYDASNGTRLWTTRYKAPGISAIALSAAASPDGSKLFVTGGTITRRGTGNDYATVAYAAPNGDTLW